MNAAGISVAFSSVNCDFLLSVSVQSCSILHLIWVGNAWTSRLLSWSSCL